MMCSVVEDVINPIFAEKGFPEIGFRIGADIGSVRARGFGAHDVASVIDLIGYPMNLTKKIQNKAGHNGILIGRQLYELIHIN
jgi:class 3 adenylate cyclase